MKKIISTNLPKINCKSKRDIPTLTWRTSWHRGSKVIKITEMDTEWIKNCIKYLERLKGKTPRRIYNYTSDWQYIIAFKKELKKRESTHKSNN